MEPLAKNRNLQNARHNFKIMEPASVFKILALIFLVVLYVFICYKIAGLRKDGSEMVTIEASTEAPGSDNSIYFIITMAVPIVVFTILFYLQKQLKANSKTKDAYFEKQVKESVHKQILNIKESEHQRLLKELTEAMKIHDNQNLEYIRLSESATKEAFFWREQSHAISNKILHCLTLDSETLDIAEAKLANPSIYGILLTRIKSWLKGSEEPKKNNGKELSVKGLEIHNKSFTSSINHFND